MEIEEQKIIFIHRPNSSINKITQNNIEFMDVSKKSYDYIIQEIQFKQDIQKIFIDLHGNQKGNILFNKEKIELQKFLNSFKQNIKEVHLFACHAGFNKNIIIPNNIELFLHTGKKQTLKNTSSDNYIGIINI